MPVRMAGVVTIALAGVTALAACSSSSSTTATGGGGQHVGSGVAPAEPSQYGEVPLAAADTGKSSTITFGGLTTSAPTWIFPVIPSANGSVYEQYQFVQESWRPLYVTYNGVHPEVNPTLSMANAPVWSNNDQTVTVTMKPDYKWSDNGQTVSSADALFFYYVVKAALKENAANWSQYTPNLGIPDEIKSVSAPDASTFVINMTKPVNPQWFEEDGLALMYAMPVHAWARAAAGGPVLDPSVPANAKKIWDYLSAQSKQTSTYATNPLWQVVDGPYKISDFNATTGAYAFTPNTTYGGPHAKVIPTLKALGFASQTALFNALKSNAVDIAEVPSADIPQIPSISGQYNLFGYPSFGFNYAVYNFKDTTNGFNNIISQLYIRQAFASLQDEAGIVRAFFHGAAGQAYGPVPAIPSTPFTPGNALSNPFPFNVQNAISILKAHGWTVNPGGTDVCSSPGTAANQCGANIPAGAKLEWNMIYDTTSSTTPKIVQDLASDARQAGITLDLQSSNFNTMIQNYDDPAAPKNNNKWAMQDFGGFSINAYPTMVGIFNTEGVYNIGGYADPHADALMQASVSSSDPAAVKAESEYLTAQQPGLFQPLEDRIWAWNKTLSGDPAVFQALTQFQLFTEQMYLK